jgi:hypothetical protein
MLKASQQEAEEGGTEKGTTCQGARTLHQVKMVSHSNYLLSRGSSTQGLPTQRCYGYLLLIKGFLVHNVLVDTGSAADIIFAKAFRRMQEPEDKIHDATHPLCGFGGRQIIALGKITMPITFGFINNTRTEQVVFDIVDMEYPYNAIIGRGTLNAFEAILHPAYLCMKIPSDQGPIAIHGSQEAARRAEGNWTYSKAIHNIDGAKACEQNKFRREKAASADQPKPMLLCEDIAEQKVLLGSQLSEEQDKTLIRFLFNNKDVFAWSANDLSELTEMLLSTRSMLIHPSDPESRGFGRCLMTRPKVLGMK